MKTTLTMLALLLISVVGQAQQAKKIENPRWKQLVYIDFEEGKYDRAISIIKDYFEKAMKKANLNMPDMMLQMYSGSWDLLLIWHLEKIEDMNWEVHPDNVAYMKSLAEVAGGEDKAKALLEEYLSYIRGSSIEMARIAY